MNEIRKTTMEDKVLRHLAVRETMDEMETLSASRTPTGAGSC